MNLQENINSFINDLLHIGDVKRNKLLNVFAGKPENTFILQNSLFVNFSAYVLSLIQERIGKPATVALKNSSLNSENEQIVGVNVNSLDWTDGLGNKDAHHLQKTFITSAYKDLSQKGTNPLYLTIGSLNWQLDDGKGVQKLVSPILIFPIRLVRADAFNTPVYIEFIQDDAHINPCLIAKLNEVFGGSVTKGFPHPNKDSIDLSLPISLEQLQTGEDYFFNLNEHLSKCNAQNESATFTLDKNFVSIISYNHDEICMYYDIQRNKENIYKNELVAKIFGTDKSPVVMPESLEDAEYIMPKDSVQEDIIKRVVNGESMIIKGPPGTGKTLTITNMVSSLLAKNKKVLLCSKKLTALSEIRAKLPESLRRFTMLLDCESEAQTASLNPSEVRKDFISLINDKKTYSQKDGLISEINQTKTKLLENAKILKEHKELTFENKAIIGKNYYDTLNLLLDKNISPIEFLDTKLAFALSKETYEFVKSHVQKIENAYEKIISLSSFEKSPYIAKNKNLFSVDTEKALDLNKEICQSINDFISGEEEFLSSLNIPYLQLDIDLLLQIASGDLKAEWLLSTIESGALNTPAYTFVEQALKDYKLCESLALNVSITNELEFETYATNLLDAKVDEDLTRLEFLEINDNLSFLSPLSKGLKLPILNKHIERHAEILKIKEDLYDEFYSIFNKAKFAFDNAFIEKAIGVFQKYFDTQKTKPNLFDFKAKSLYKKLATLGYKKEIAFNQVVNGLKIQEKILALKNETIDILDKISSLLKEEVSESKLHSIILSQDRASKLGLSFADYILNFESYCNLVTKLLGCVRSENFTLLALKNKAKEFIAEKTLLGAVISLDSTATIKTAKSIAEKLVSAHLIADNKLLGEKEYIKENLNKIASRSGAITFYLNSVKEKFIAFEKQFFTSYYADISKRLSISDLKLFAKICCDRDLLGASIEYSSLKSAPMFSLFTPFLVPFENGKDFGGCVLSEVFEHSVYYLATKEFLKKLGKKRNGLGEKVEKAYEEYFSLDKKLQSLTTSLIESKCMSKINPEDTAFAFLNTARSQGETLRLLFKKNADAIIKLKKCFLLSPSTTSVLLTNKVFFDFDVVICDEASQLEPTSLLPLLIRTKQIVLVGDEWQMPPIKRYASVSEKKIDEGDGEYTILSPNLSALSLALKNGSLKTASLNCHYRSKTETLISFSQKLFYPFMHTFPAVEPKKDGVGLNDIYIEDGCVIGGENEKEATTVVNLIKEHFEKYFNEKKGVLTQSVGVVCFGEKQVALIESLIAKDKDLTRLIEKAKINFSDPIKEKLFFVKPIDKVQGQEIEHLILSLTYGKDENGKVKNAFGELNRGNQTDKLGQCIFNVAVTRAKSSVTVVRSIHHTDITRESVQYIAEYLKQVERFKTNGKEQFVGDDIDKATGFQKQVVNFLMENGISKNRIVLNYGVTDNSIKIPLVILNQSETKAVLGIWLENSPNKEYDYFDYNLKYYEILKEREWNLYRLFIHDFFDNNESEKKQLLQIIEKLK